MILSLVAVLASVRTGGIIRHEVYEQEGFNPFFQLARQPQFRCVGTFIKPNGVWIGGRYVLTVAHGFVSPNGELSDPSTLRFNLLVEGRYFTYRGRALHVPKSYIQSHVSKQGTGNLTHDIAVVELANEPTVPGLQPAVVNSGEGEVGLDAVFVGYGDRGTSKEGANLELFGSGQSFPQDQYGDRQPRPMGFQNSIDSTLGSGFCLASSFRGAKKHRLLGITASGDSGSGVFAQIDNEWKLIGIAHNGIPRAGSGQPTWAKGNTEGSSTLCVRASKFWKAIMLGRKGDWTEFESM